MNRYTVTRTRVDSIEIEAASQEAAEFKAGIKGAFPDQGATCIKAERIHTEFEYRVRIEADDDADRSWEESAEDIEAADTYGYVGFVAERRAVDTEDGEPGEWEHVDSCWGFVAAPGYEEAIRAHLSAEFADCDF